MNCRNCGIELGDNFITDTNGDHYCEECAETELVKCDRCGDYHPVEDSYRVITNNGWYDQETEQWCEDCRCRHAFTCEHCGEIYSSDCDHIIMYNGDTVCQDCREDHVGYCAGCDEYYHIDDLYWDDYNEEYYCEECHRERSSSDRIQGYHCRPTTKYYLDKNDSTYNGGNFKGYGIELEIDRKNPSNHNDSVEMLNETLGDHVYYNRDGSLNYGYEIITQPHTRQALLSLDWQTALGELVRLGYLSHDIKTCGLHMHVSRLCFGDTEEKRTENIAKILLFYNHYWNDILRFSRRTESQANSWATRYESIRTQTDAESIAKSRNYSRYYAVNLCNRDTVEFRLMRGTLNYATFRATLDLLMTMVENCDSVTDIENLDQWFKGLETSTLEYMAQRRCFGHSAETTDRVQEPTDNGTVDQPLQVGDKVQFREWDDMANEYGTNWSGNINCDNTFMREMKHLCGTYATVVDASDTTNIKLTDFTTTGGVTNWSYSIDMIRRV